MSDSNVFISGSAGGSLRNAFDGLPQWATEKTLKEVKKLLEKTLNVKGSNTKTSGSDLFGGGTKSFDDLKDTMDDLNSSTSHLRDKFGDFADHIDESSRAFRAGTIAGQMYNDRMYALIKASEIMIDVYNVMRNVIESNMNSFDQMFKAGRVVMESSNETVSGFNALRIMVARTGLGLEDLVEVMTNSYGVHSAGADKFTKALDRGDKEMRRFGYNTKETAQLMAVYLDSMSNLGAAQNITSEEVSTYSKSLGESFTKLSLRTGQSIKKLQEQTSAISASIEANVLAATYGTQAAIAASAFAASFRNEQLGKDFVDMMAAKIPSLNKTFTNLVSGGLGMMGKKIMDFNKTVVGMNPADAERARRSFLKGLTDLDAAINFQQLQAEAGNVAAAENLKTLIALKQERDAARDITDEEIQMNQETADSLKGFQSAIMSTKATLQKLFMPFLYVLDVITIALDAFNGIVGTILESPVGTFISAITVGAIGILAGFAALVLAIKACVAVAAGFTMAMKAATIATSTKAGGNAVGGVASTVADKIAGGTGGTGGAAGTGKNTGGSGGIGNGVGNLLTGISKGIASFASPKVVAGALVMAGLGLTFYSLGKGLTSFNEVEWASVGKAGVTLVALAGATAVLGLAAPLVLAGAAAMGAMGAAGWILGKSFEALGTGIAPIIDDVVRLGNIDAGNMVAMAGGLIALSGALTVFAASTALSGGISTIGSIFNGGLFSNIERIAQIAPSLETASLSVNTLATGIRDLAEAVNVLNAVDLGAGINKINQIKASSNLGRVVQPVTQGVSNNVVNNSTTSSVNNSVSNNNTNANGQDVGLVIMSELLEQIKLLNNRAVQQDVLNASMVEMLKKLNSSNEEIVRVLKASI